MGWAKIHNKATSTKRSILMVLGEGLKTSVEKKGADEKFKND